jgi:ribose-phosphate pyrophosphokinase
MIPLAGKPLPAKPERRGHSGELMIFGGDGGFDLAKSICRYLDIPQGTAHLEDFPDGESFVKLEVDVRGRDCFVVQSTSPPVNDNLMQLLIFIDCLRRASANRITAVIPYFGYARQDRKSEGRTPITAKMLANLITAAGAHRVVTLDLHADQIQGFFDIPVDHLTGFPLIAREVKKLGLENTVIVSPDVGNLKTANKYATALGGEIAIIDKRRRSGDTVEMTNVIGDVKDKNVLLFDDMITTGGTLASAARLVRKFGAKSVYAGATHGIFAGPCIQRLLEADFKRIWVTDSVPERESVIKTLPNLQVVTVAELLGEAIRRIHRDESISALFRF